MLGLPPRFGVYPVRILELDLPAHLRETYIVLYTLGWRTEYRTVQQSVSQLAELFSTIEGKPINARGMRKRLQDLAEVGLVERSMKEGRWVTVLKLRHEVSGTGSATPWHPECQGGIPGVPHLDKSIAVVVDQSVQQQRDYSRSGTEFEENEELLRAMGLVGDVVRRLAAEEHVTPQYLEGVKAYRDREAAQGRILGTGWVVTCVGQAWKLPEEIDEHDPSRYVSGKYKDYIRY
jgi:hypothetical protein